MRRSVAALLIAQAVALGLLLAYLVIPGSAAFLDAYGPERLPYLYLLVAVVGSVVSIAIHRLERNHDLFSLAIGTELLWLVVVAVSWFVLRVLDQAAGAFVVMTLFAVQLQLGFVFIGAQAGRAFDVQRIKSVFPRIVAGFVFGFMAGGFLAEPLLALASSPLDLLLVAVVVIAAMVGLLSLTVPLVPPVPAVPSVADGPPTPSLLRLMSIPLVGAVFAYQLLSAMGTQLIEYLVYDRAAARYSGAAELATFMGRFTAVLNLVDLLVLLLVGSLLMARYGLRFGVAANPIVVSGLVLVALVISATGGTTGTALFLVVGVARVTDLTMADVATRTSVNATLQALPVRQRLPAQVGIEGAGVPLALGLTAAAVLAINAIPGSSVTHVILFTAVVCGLWCALSLVVYRRYREAIVAAAKRRTLDEQALDVAEPVTREVLLALAESGSGPEVAMAVGLLSGGAGGADGEDDARVDDVLAAAATNPSLAVRHGVLGPLVPRFPEEAERVGLDCVASGDPVMARDGFRAIGRIGGPATAHVLAGGSDGGTSGLRAPALGARLAIAARGVGEPVAGEVAGLVAAADVEDRATAAEAVGEAFSALSGHEAAAALDQLARPWLRRLLTDDDHRVRAAAAVAFGRAPGPLQAALFPELSAEGGPAVAEVFRARPGSIDPAFRDAVLGWLDGAGRDDTARAVRFLAAGGWTAVSDHPALARLVAASTAQVSTAAAWLGRLPPASAVTGEWVPALRRALSDEHRQAQLRLLDVLGLAYDGRLTGRISHLLAGRVGGDRAVALEALDLTLDQHHRAAVVEALRPPPEPSGDEPAPTVAAALAEDVGWAQHPDWLQATALAVLAEHGLSPAGRTPHGPASTELIEAAV